MEVLLLTMLLIVLMMSALAVVDLHLVGQEVPPAPPGLDHHEGRCGCRDGRRDGPPLVRDGVRISSLSMTMMRC